MPKTKKPNKIHFGIEITKPFSKEMYAHNDKIALELKSNILEAWNNLIKHEEPGDFCEFTSWTDIPEDSDIVKLQKNVMYSGYGDGFTMGDVNNEFVSELETMPNWQIHEVYAYCCFEGLVPRTKQGMVGFDWEKMNYWTDAIHDVLLGIGGDGLRGGPGVEDRYIKVYSQSEGDEIVSKLAKLNIEAYVDCYEADDGDEYPGGPPIMLKFYSVQIKKS